MGNSCASRERKIEERLDTCHTCKIVVSKLRHEEKRLDEENEKLWVSTRQYHVIFCFCDGRFIESSIKEGYTQADAFDRIKITWLKYAPKEHTQWCAIYIDAESKKKPEVK